MFAPQLLLALAPFAAQELNAVRSDEIHWVAPPSDATLETKHYLLFMEGTPEEIKRRGELVEAAWSGYKKVLGGAPKTRRGKKTILRVFPSRALWRKGMDLEQEVPPKETLYQHYSPDRKTVYVYEGESDYSTNKWLLYGTFLDFHRDLKPKNKALAKEWFVTGMADALSTHSWRDGDLQLGSRLVLARNNRARNSIGYGVLPYIEDGEVSQDDLMKWEVRWAMTAFMLFGADGKYTKKFERMALGSRGSMLLGRDLLPSIGEPKQVTAEMVAWIKDQARILETTGDGVWEEDGWGLRGHARGNWQLSFAIPDENTDYIEAVCGAHNFEQHGFVVDWVAKDDYIRALLRGEYLAVEHVYKGRASLLHEAQIRRGPKGHIKMSMERKGQGVLIRAKGTRPFQIPVKSRKFGLAVGPDEAEFQDIFWR